MQNSKKLTRLPTVYSGMVFYGKKKLNIHDSINENVFVIDHKTSSLVLNDLEVEQLVIQMIKSLNNINTPRLDNFLKNIGVNK